MPRLEEVKSAIKEQGQSWKAGETEVGIQFEKHFESGNFRSLGLSIGGPEPSGGPGRPTQQRFAFQAVIEPPELVDWRDVNGKDWTTKVRDQRRCGACVSFATCAVLGSRIKIGRADAKFDIDLSVAHLFFCGAGDNACEDGWQIGQALNRSRKYGVGKESDFPYQDRQIKCKKTSPYVRVSRWRRPKEIIDRKKALYLRGPVIGAMVVYSDFVWYKGGVYRPTTAEVVGLHAIAVIGYDDPKGCWIVQNSWGAKWGVGGYTQIGYGCCGIDAQFEFYDPEVDLENPP